MINKEFSLNKIIETVNMPDSNIHGSNKAKELLESSITNVGCGIASVIEFMEIKEKLNYSNMPKSLLYGTLAGTGIYLCGLDENYFTQAAQYIAISTPMVLAFKDTIKPKKPLLDSDGQKTKGNIIELMLNYSAVVVSEFIGCKLMNYFMN